MAYREETTDAAGAVVEVRTYDATAGFTRTGPGGQVLEQRPLSPPEVTLLAAYDDAVRAGSLRDRAETLLPALVTNTSMQGPSLLQLSGMQRLHDRLRLVERVLVALTRDHVGATDSMAGAS